MKNCWIIGASSGIGLELVKKYYENDYNVVISSRSLNDLENLKTTILAENPQKNNEIFIANFDVVKIENFTDALQNILQKFSQIDLVIFASALYERFNAENFDLNLAKKIIDVNFNGFLNLLHLIIPQFLKQKSGHIACIASVAGYSGLPQSFVYGASKSALINLCEGIYPELKHKNIALSIINPGFVKTRLTEKNNFEMPFIISPKQASDYIYQGLNAKKFEIHFPKKFTYILKFLRILPYGFYLKIITKIYQKNIK
ncbi:MAG: SDR family NAD(P)-dependent oxidoreductase [Alphaproteobacteria bacterium]